MDVVSSSPDSNEGNATNKDDIVDQDPNSRKELSKLLRCKDQVILNNLKDNLK